MDEITDLISVLCETRPERFPFERIISLFGFTAWLNNPDDDIAVDVAMVVAECAIFQSNLKPFKDKNAKGQMAERLLTRDVLTQTVLYLRYGYHEVAHDHLVPLSEIVKFFFKCPNDITPSINRAFHFITEGGASVALDKTRISKQTLNRVWTKFAQISPFVVAADYFEAYDFIYLVPDDRKDLNYAYELVSNGSIKTYFECALAIQNLLLGRFDPKTRDRFSWVQFPKGLKAADFDDGQFAPYEKKQLEMIRKYKAKRPSK